MTDGDNLKQMGEKQKEIKKLSSVIEMIGNIGSIVLKVAIPFMILVMIFGIFVINNIKVVDNEILFKSDNVKIVDENKIEIYGLIIGELDGDFLEGEIIEVLKHNSNLKNIILFEIIMICLLIEIVVMMLILTYVKKMFGNIKREKTPFILDNVKFIRKISYLLITLILISSIPEILFNITTGIHKVFDRPFEIMDILQILIIFSMSYVFEYGYNIQIVK